MNFSRLLAGRYLNPVRSHVSAITLISLVGVMLGVAVLIVVLSIHAGFEREVKKLLLGFAPHVEVQEVTGFVSDWDQLEDQLNAVEGVTGSYALIQDFVLVDAPGYRKPVAFRAIDTDDQAQIEALEELLDQEGYPGSRADIGIDEYTVISRQLAQDLMLSVGDEVEVYASRNFDVVKEAFERINVEPLRERFGGELASLQEFITRHREAPEVALAELQGFYGTIEELRTQEAREAELESLNQALIALSAVDRNAAEDAYLVPGETWQEVADALQAVSELDVDAADLATLKNIKEIVLPKKLTVWGVYGDSQRTPGPQMFIPLPIGQELTGLTNGVQAVAVRLEDPFHAIQGAEKIEAALGEEFVTATWMDRHVAQFALIRTERLMMTFALSFIGIISAFSIMAVMYTVTIQKKQEIGVMKALGATGPQISWVFLWQGLVVGFFGALGGVALALLIIWQRAPIQRGLASVGFDPFPADFQGFSELPARIMPGFMIFVAIAAWLLCGLAALLPALKAARNDAAKSLRNL
ncbi:FtsX-like permease family protein [Roseibacillus ishigakijimensis]|uniref:ABC transporter permease n=1 Tax=Roseibacillus ishigakijimensis TaxID=454146 RepID=A0A934VG51_9BACT|nr:FtsX-like permease family protein [Roseibacillus ishigakijimensis]MBK1832458.1 ABC transporter permease [Roseibacillus ishigakijimensis]